MDSASRPELIFVAGPQAGSRVVLMGDVSVAGRSDTVEIPVAEQYVSRRQLQFVFSGDGWTVENLASSPIRINGKKYKAGKKVVLATGDLVGMGMSTELLFVAPGDDPEEALHTLGASGALPSVSAAGLAGRRDASDMPPPFQSAGPLTAPLMDADASEPKTEQLNKLAGANPRNKKVVILVAAELVIVCGLVVWMAGIRGARDDGPAPASQAFLSDDDIAKAISDPHPSVRDLDNAKRNTDKARAKYANLWAPEDRYLCLRYLKDALACQGRDSFTDRELSDMYNNLRLELTKRVQLEYRAAWRLEEQGNWPDAKLAFKRIRRLVPEDDKTYPAFVIYDNIGKHLEYINRQMAVKRRR